MNKDDMILVSVDDHLVEPPDMFEGHLPAKYADDAPRLVHNDDGSDVWEFSDTDDPEHRRSTRSPAGPRRSTASSRRPSTRCGPAATTSTSASRT